MMELTRRSLLTKVASLGVVGGLIGCSTPNGSETSTETPEQLYGLSGSYTIQPDQFRDLAIDLDDPAVIEYTADVRSGPNIDIFVLSRGEFREYERGNEFEILEDASSLDTSYGDVRANVGPADSNVVFDNTDAGASAPPESDGTVELTFELSVTRQSK